MSEDLDYAPGDVGPEKAGLAIPAAATGLVGALFARLFGVALADAGAALKARAPMLVALGLDAAAVAAAYARDGKGDALLVAAAIVASMAFLPRIAFSIAPPPIP